jgi:NAD(P)-dependent dehydrogenase (short-subunit alcohol dehydrogenase family)
MMIVTGASRGIGAAIAVLLGRWRTRDRCAAGDVSREEDVVRIFETAESELGPMEGLVNNAAITGGFARVEDTRADVIERMLAVNVTGTMLCCREAVRRMSTRRGGKGGEIVNISSTSWRTARRTVWIA